MTKSVFVTPAGLIDKVLMLRYGTTTPTESHPSYTSYKVIGNV
jgi:hypothetical protein